MVKEKNLMNLETEEETEAVSSCPAASSLAVYFFIGTEAELIKVFPVYVKLQNLGCTCHVIASGQNDITKSRIFKEYPINGKIVELSREEDIKKTTTGLLSWFIKTKSGAIGKITSAFSKEKLKGGRLVVHGDTVSTFMGAMVGKSLGMTVCHVEAGLRSHHLFNPFPEEIDRLLTSRIARVHFAPGDEAYNNLKKAKGKVINTKANTLSDSLKLSQNIPLISQEVRAILKEKEDTGSKYFVFVMHRQENLANPSFVSDVVKRIVNAAESTKCVIILHKITESTFERLGLMESLRANGNIVMLYRVDYFDFMKLLNGARFVITDGGSNQEELYYMRKPCLIMRKATERSEGLGINARLFNGQAGDVEEFIRSVSGEEKVCEMAGALEEAMPSEIIAGKIVKCN